MEPTPMTARSQDSPTTTRASEKGQRLYCQECGSEIEILSPCTCQPPDQVLRCCGKDMTPMVGVEVHVNVDS
jgi:hypothetical protein